MTAQTAPSCCRILPDGTVLVGNEWTFPDTRGGDDHDYIERHWGACIFTRQGLMALGKPVLGHQHNFDHVTFVTRGQIELVLLDVLEVNVDGNPLKARTVVSKVLDADSDDNGFLVMKGRFHMLIPHTDRARYQCTYAAQLPQALTVEPGRRFTHPITKRDEDGVVWYRANDKIVEMSDWMDAYR